MSEAARQRVGRAQAELLAALVAAGPVPAGFDTRRLEVQARALRAKRADVVAKVAPELPQILGAAEYRRLFAAYATGRPLAGNHRWDALDFAAYALRHGRLPRRVRKPLKSWRAHRLGPAPPGGSAA